MWGPPDMPKPPKDFVADSILTNTMIQNEGERAFCAGVSPDHCPYWKSSNTGTFNIDLANWIYGWSQAYRKDALAGWSPAF